MFRGAFRRSRCVIPASGYYELRPTPTGKRPYYSSARDGSVLSFAGLWEEWRDIGKRREREVVHHHRYCGYTISPGEFTSACRWCSSNSSHGRRRSAQALACKCGRCRRR